MSKIKSWDIFCRVIDNYGDIGVCWRLARQLANEYPFHIRLWVDDLTALRHIWPETKVTNQQTLEGIDVCLWYEQFPEDIQPANVVIEAFACHLPEVYLKAMKKKPPQWFNLEYLSAEDWVEGCHGLVSMDTQTGLKKTYFFPGFTVKTGGLLREQTLLSARNAFLADAPTKAAFLSRLGISLTGESNLLVSLFSYENTAIGSLLDSWIQSSEPIMVLVPASKLLPDINRHLQTQLNINDEYSCGALRVRIIPFLTQTQYDQLLWACDINFVRGEDSFVRAQWAAKPFIWHIYPQDDGIHLEKLSAFLNHYLSGLSLEEQTAIANLWHNWNQGKNCGEAWNECLKNRQNWDKHTKEWSYQLNSLGDLASNMVQFCQKTL